MSLSKKVIRAEKVKSTQPFMKILQEELAARPDPISQPGPKKGAGVRVRLGRTAERLERMRNEAVKEGYHRGYVDGAEAGRRDGKAQAYNEQIEACRSKTAEFAREIDSLAGQVLAAMRQWRSDAEEELTDLAILIAERALASEMMMNRDAVVAIAREAMREVTFGDHATIRVNPFDLPSLRENREIVLSVAPNLKNLEIVADDSIAGGCIIETDSGSVDATIATKLRLLCNPEMQEAA